MTSGTTGARPRRSRQELRELLLAAAIEVLRQDGLGTGAEHLTFKRVFEQVAATTGVRITNASVIGRIWANQAEFQSAVLAAMASEEITDQERVVMESIADFAATVDRSSVESRRAALREFMRIAAEANLTSGTTSTGWATVIGVWALASGSRGSGATDPIYESMRASYAAVEKRGIAATEALLAFLGMRPRDPFSVRQFTTACTALVEGCALRDRAEGGIRGIELATGPGGTIQPWTVLGIGMEALAEQFFEFDPDWTPDGAP
jgi:hypothetical protein